MNDRRARLEWLAPAAGLIVLAALLLWWASGALLALLVELHLRDAGWPGASVAGVSLGPGGVELERVQLAPDDAFTAENVRARIGRRGIESIAVSRLRLRATVTAEGELVLPGSASAANGPLPLDLLPPQGVTVLRAETDLETPAGALHLALSGAWLRGGAAGAELAADYVLEHAAASLEGRAAVGIRGDRSVDGRFEVDRGRIEAAGLRATGLSGTAAASLPARGARALRLEILAGATSLAELALGALVLEAQWRDGVAELALRPLDARAADVEVSVRADLTDASTAFVSGRARLNAAQASGTLGFDAELARRAGGAPGVSGRLRLAARDLAVPGAFDQVAFDVAARVHGDAERLRFAAEDAWTATVAPAAASLPQAMHALLGEDILVTAVPAGDPPLALELDWAEQSARLEGRLEAHAGEARASVAARLEGSWAGGVELASRVAHFSARGLPWEGALLGIEEFEGSASYAPDHWHVEGLGTVRAEGAVLAATVEGLTAKWSGTITGTPEGIAVNANGCTGWSVAALDIAGVRVEGLAPPCIRPGDGGLLLAYDDEEGRTRFAGETAEKPLDAQLLRGGEKVAVTGTWPALTISGSRDAEGLESMVAKASGGALILPQEVAAAGVSGAIELRRGTVVSAALDVAVIESLARPALWAPASLEADAAGGDDGVSFGALISDELGRFVLEASGRYADGQGSAKLLLYPVQLISGATEIADLSPYLAERVRDASGRIEFRGEVAWGSGGAEGAGTLSVQDLEATLGGVAIAGATTEARFANLVPPATLPEQRLEIARVDLGVPLERGTIVYDADAGRLAIRRLEFDFAGGRLHAEPFTVDSARAGDIELVLHAEEVELARLLVLSGIEGLEGTGVLSGRVPVRLSAHGLRLDEGVLAAQTEGVLRYIPQNLPAFLRGDDERTRMLREVLKNFNYDALSVSIAGESGEGGAQRLTLSAQGANPDFLEGHPIELNFSFQGPLLGTVRSAVEIAGGQALQEMLEQQGSNDEENAR